MLFFSLAPPFTLWYQPVFITPSRCASHAIVYIATPLLICYATFHDIDIQKNIIFILRYLWYTTFIFFFFLMPSSSLLFMSLRRYVSPSSFACHTACYYYLLLHITPCRSSFLPPSPLHPFRLSSFCLRQQLHTLFTIRWCHRYRYRCCCFTPCHCLRLTIATPPR